MYADISKKVGRMRKAREKNKGENYDLSNKERVAFVRINAKSEREDQKA